jgi:hydrogenase-4 component E
VSADILLETRLIDLIYVLALAAVLWAVASSGIPSMIRLFGFQSFLLACGTALIARVANEPHLLGAALFTIVFKVFLIPLVLTYVMNRLKIRKEIEDYINIPSSLILCSLLTIVAYAVTLRVIQTRAPFNVAGVFAVALAIMLIGFFIMVNRKKTLTQILGLMFVENGVFLAAVAMTYGMPLLVEFGIFFDVFVATLIMGIMLFKIWDTLSDMDYKENL